MSVEKVLLFPPSINGYIHLIQVWWLKVELLDLNSAHQMIYISLDASTYYNLPSYNDWRWEDELQETKGGKCAHN
jgi:hypothetical protein